MSVALRMPRPPSREVAVLAAVAFSVALGYSIVAPVIAAFARSFGVDRTAAGSVVSAFSFMRLVSVLFGGRLVDQFGERVVLATGIAIVGVSSALAGLAQNYSQLLVLRGVGGVGSAMFSVSAMSLVLRSTAPAQRGRAAGLFSGAFLVGGVAGPALGSGVAHLGYRAPFFIYAGTLTIAGTIGMLALPRHVKGAGGTNGGASEAPAPTPARTALRHPAYRAALAANLADVWVVIGLRSSLVPLFVVEVLDLPQRWIYWGFLIVAGCNAATLWPAGRFSDTRGRKPMLVAGLLLVAASVSLLGGSRSLPAYVVAMVVLGIGSGMLNVAPAAVVGDVVHGRGGQAVAAYQMAGDVGAVVGPLVAGLLADRVSYGAAFGVSAAVLVVAAVLALIAPETRHATAGAGTEADADVDEPPLVEPVT